MALQLLLAAAPALYEPAANQSSSIFLVSTSMGDGKEYCDLTDKNHAEYAKRNGYGYARYSESNIPQTGNPKWGKLAAIQRHQNNGQTWVVWVDCDIVFTSMERKLEPIMEQYGQSTSLIIARDAWWRKPPPEGAPVNSGLMLFKDNPWSQQFVARVEREGKVPGTNLEDQPRITLILEETGNLKNPAVEEQESHTDAAVVSQRVMNAFLRDGEEYNAEDPPESRWRPGDLCAHVTGMASGKRVAIIEDLLRKNKVPKVMQELLSESAPELRNFFSQQTQIDKSAGQQAALIPDMRTVLTDEVVSGIETKLRTEIIKALLREEGADYQRIKELTGTDWFVGEQQATQEQAQPPQH